MHSSSNHLVSKLPQNSPSNNQNERSQTPTPHRASFASNPLRTTLLSPLFNDCNIHTIILNRLCDFAALAESLQLLVECSQDIRASSLRAEFDFPAAAAWDDESGSLVIKGEAVGVGTDCFGGSRI